jgi:hypothetical protein
MVQFIPQHLVAVVGLVVGSAAGGIVAAAMKLRSWMTPHRLVMAAATLFITMLVACSSGTPTASNASVTPRPPSPTASSQPASPTPDAPTAAIARAPTPIAVTFSGLRAGRYPVHLHSTCSGRPNFHITVVQSLAVGSGGRGTIVVPSSYFGRGLCLIVYTSPSLSGVLTTRQI